MKLSQNVDFDKLARYTPSYVGRDFKDLCSEAKKLAGKRVSQELAQNSDDLTSLCQVLESSSNDEKLLNLTVEMKDFEAALKKVQPAAKREGFATIPDVTWEDVGAMEDVRKDIELKVLARVNNPDAAKVCNLESPTGVLLCGQLFVYIF